MLTRSEEKFDFKQRLYSYCAGYIYLSLVIWQMVIELENTFVQTVERAQEMEGAI